MAFGVCCQNSWAVFFRSGFMTLEGRYCLWLRILRTVVQQRHPESLQASSSRPTPSLRSLPISLWLLGCGHHRAPGSEGLGWWVVYSLLQLINISFDATMCKACNATAENALFFPMQTTLMKIPTVSLPWVVKLCLIVWEEYYLRKSKWIPFTSKDFINKSRQKSHFPPPPDCGKCWICKTICSNFVF